MRGPKNGSAGCRRTIPADGTPTRSSCPRRGERTKETGIPIGKEVNKTNYLIRNRVQHRATTVFAVPRQSTEGTGFFANGACAGLCFWPLLLIGCCCRCCWSRPSQRQRWTGEFVRNRPPNWSRWSIRFWDAVFQRQESLDITHRVGRAGGIRGRARPTGTSCFG